MHVHNAVLRKMPLSLIRETSAGKAIRLARVGFGILDFLQVKKMFEFRVQGMKRFVTFSCASDSLRLKLSFTRIFLTVRINKFLANFWQFLPTLATSFMVSNLIGNHTKSMQCSCLALQFARLLVTLGCAAAGAMFSQIPLEFFPELSLSVMNLIRLLEQRGFRNESSVS